MYRLTQSQIFEHVVFGLKVVNTECRCARCMNRVNEANEVLEMVKAHEAQGKRVPNFAKYCSARYYNVPNNQDHHGDEV
jgi:hypothetical protein